MILYTLENGTTGVLVDIPEADIEHLENINWRAYEHKYTSVVTLPDGRDVTIRTTTKGQEDRNDMAIVSEIIDENPFKDVYFTQSDCLTPEQLVIYATNHTYYTKYSFERDRLIPGTHVLYHCYIGSKYFDHLWDMDLALNYTFLTPSGSSVKQVTEYFHIPGSSFAEAWNRYNDDKTDTYLTYTLITQQKDYSYPLPKVINVRLAPRHVNEIGPDNISSGNDFMYVQIKANDFIINNKGVNSYDTFLVKKPYSNTYPGTIVYDYIATTSKSGSAGILKQPPITIGTDSTIVYKDLDTNIPPVKFGEGKHYLAIIGDDGCRTGEPELLFDSGVYDNLYTTALNNSYYAIVSSNYDQINDDWKQVNKLTIEMSNPEQARFTARFLQGIGATTDDIDPIPCKTAYIFDYSTTYTTNTDIYWLVKEYGSENQVVDITTNIAKYPLRKSSTVSFVVANAFDATDVIDHPEIDGASLWATASETGKTYSKVPIASFRERYCLYCDCIKENVNGDNRVRITKWYVTDVTGSIVEASTTVGYLRKRGTTNYYIESDAELVKYVNDNVKTHGGTGNHFITFLNIEDNPVDGGDKLGPIFKDKPFVSIHNAMLRQEDPPSYEAVYPFPLDENLPGGYDNKELIFSLKVANPDDDFYTFRIERSYNHNAPELVKELHIGADTFPNTKQYVYWMYNMDTGELHAQYDHYHSTWEAMNLD